MHLGVPKGYSSIYKVLASQGDNQFPNVNDTIKFEVLDISAMRLYNRANQMVLYYETALTNVSLNGDNGLGSYSVEHALDSVRYGSIEVFLDAASFPFYPVSTQFWIAMSDYCPGLKVSHVAGSLVVADEFFYHYIYAINGTELVGYMHAYLRIDIDALNGVVHGCELGCKETFNATTFEDSSMVIQFVGETFAGESPGSQVIPYVLIPMAMSVPLLLVVSNTYLRRRGRRVRGIRKSEILSRLDDATLLKLSKKVPGASVNRRAGRSALINVIRESFSVQEISEKVKEL